MDLDDLLVSAHRRGGFFTLADVRSAGFTLHGVRSRVARGEWRRLHPGVFVVSSWYATLDRSGRHLVALRARLHLLDDGWCAARRSAAAVHGLPTLGAQVQVPQLVRDRPAAATRGSSRHERFNGLPAEERTEVDGTRVTSLARTVVDLAREESFRSALVVADAALARGLPAEELVAVADRCARWPRAPRVRPVLLHADGRSESPLESISRAGFLRAGLPMPELQVEVWYGGALVGRVDFLWRQFLVVGEADGRTKYTAVDDLYAEKRREERLRDLGLEVVRWDWPTAYHRSRELADILQRAFVRGARGELAPGVVLRPMDQSRAA